jgi:DNA-binding NarL/FixJ family response regulator
MTSVVIADPHALVRACHKSLLSSDAGLRVIAEAATGGRAIELVEKLEPDILILELSFPDMHGLEVIHTVAGSKSNTVVVTDKSDPPRVMESLQAGASAYILKEDLPQDILNAIASVSAGQHYLSPKLRNVTFKRAFGSASAPKQTYLELSMREREVLRFAAEGLQARGIGEKLFISPRTVETHRANIMRKLGLRNHTDLVRFAVRWKVIQA